MGLFERYLSLWVALCIASGITLGTLFPGVFQIFASLEYASVNLPVAVLIWLMIYPMDDGASGLCINQGRGQAPQRIDPDSRGQLADQALHYGWTGLAIFSRPVC